MLRRKPTALTVTSEDIASFEESHARKVAYAKFLKTGEDPNGYFRHAHPGGSVDHVDQRSTTDSRSEAVTKIDPNDELKPLPGDKARIVRSREERIAGTGTGR